mmetsp:Transcript_84367/g.219585  ORF Transcript_84367/g.219585 Transcript_84367/m.219585 type:complete len:504 (+) Transcript_84367:68-1579(+)
MDRRLVYHVGFASLSGFLLGYDLCFIGSVLVAVQDSLEFCFPCEGGYSTRALAKCNCPAKSFAVSAVSIGAIIGGLAGGTVAEKLGRRVALMITDILFVLGAAAMAVAGADSTWLFYFGRIASGAALGAGGSTASAYIAEIAPAHLRGRLIEFNELMVCAGCLVAFVAAAAFGDDLWRWTVGVAALPACIQLLGLIAVVHESPRWLLARGRRRKAEAAAAALSIDLVAIPAPSTNSSEGGIGLVGTTWAHRKPMLIALGCTLAHNATAANVILYFSRNVLERAGVREPLLANVAVGTVKFVGVCIALAVVDRLGRRALLLAGTAGIVASQAILVLAFASDAEAPIQSLALAGMLSFILFWDVSWAGLMLVVISEVLPQPIRAMGAGLAYSVYNLVSFVEEQSLQTLFGSLTVAGTFGLYCGLSAVALLFVWQCLPETGGTSLEALEAQAEVAGPACCKGDDSSESAETGSEEESSQERDAAMPPSRENSIAEHENSNLAAEME